MREFDSKASAAKLLTNDTGNMLSYIHEYKEQQNLLIETKADVLSHLLEIAKLQSTEASNRIEGLDTSDERIKALVKEKSTPRNRNENEIAGYRDVLATTHENYDYIPSAECNFADAPRPVKQAGQGDKERYHGCLPRYQHDHH